VVGERLSRVAPHKRSTSSNGFTSTFRLTISASSLAFQGSSNFGALLMRAETENQLESAKQSIGLLRRHL